MIKILFMIHDLGKGGAERVLVNLVNNMDHSKFDITVCSLFAGGVYDQAFVPEVKVYFVFKKSFPANSKILKLMSPKQLHKLFVKGHYDIEISYLEGPSARIISGCEDADTKLVSWIHSKIDSLDTASKPFRSVAETKGCYNRFDQTVCVARSTMADFCRTLNYKKPCRVLYNTVESEKIIALSQENAPELGNDNKIRLVTVGTLKPVKGFDRLLRVTGKLRDAGYPIHLYILGSGPQEAQLQTIVKQLNLEDSVDFLGFQNNPYKYVAKCDLYVCSSLSEGFSTAVTEALIVGTPVCTVEVSGMKEMLGENSEYGLVTENSEAALYDGIKSLLDHPERIQYYHEKTMKRRRIFSTMETVGNVENMLEQLYREK